MGAIECVGGRGKCEYGFTLICEIFIVQTENIIQHIFARNTKPFSLYFSKQSQWHNGRMDRHGSPWITIDHSGLEEKWAFGK
jgi:hypothetical protein